MPLVKTSKVLITGPAANSLNYLNGAWTSTWQGADSSFNTKNKQTILSAITSKIGVQNVNYVEGTSYDKSIIGILQSNIDFIVNNKNDLYPLLFE